MAANVSKIDEDLLNVENIYGKLFISEERKYSPITKEEGEFLFRFLKNKKIKKTLEVGLSFGRSAAYITSATRFLHYAIDPYQKKNYHNAGLDNLKNIGLGKFVQFMGEFSHFALPKLAEKGVKVDFAFVDGDHKFDYMFIDFYYIDLLLNDQGYVLFHDSWLRSTQHVASWIEQNKKSYRKVPTPMKNFLLFKKIGNDERTLFHFKDFWTLKSTYRQWKNVRRMGKIKGVYDQ